MRPTPIPDDEIFHGHRRMVIGPPEGCDPTGSIRPVETCAELQPGNVPVYRFRIVLDDGDLDRLRDGEPFWLSMWSAVVPWDAGFADPID